MKTAVVVFIWDKHLPALDAFLAQHPIDTLVVPSSMAAEPIGSIAAAHGAEIRTIDSFGVPKDDDERKSRAAVNKRVTKAIGTLLKEPGWADAFLAEGDSGDDVAEIVRKHLPEALRGSINLLVCLFGLLETHDVRLLLVPEDFTGRGKVAASWARTVGVPSLHLAHSLALVDPYTVHAHLMTDVLAVYGERGGEGYLDLGIEADRIVPTGNPSWDGYSTAHEDRPRLRAELAEKHGFDPTRPVVVFATTWSGGQTAFDTRDAHGRTVAAFLAGCADLASRGVDFVAVVKDRQPNPDDGLVQRLVAEQGFAGTLVHTFDDGPSWVVAADAVVGIDSNYLVEGMLCGTPVVTLIGEALLPGPAAFDADSGVVMADRGNLGSRLYDLLEDDAYRERQLALASAAAGRYNVGGADGGSAQRVADLMSSLASRPRAQVSSDAPRPSLARRVVRRLRS